ncbi:MAG: methionine--tRNA ligase, partial [Gammaproteobacteria bacterium RIFCSPHIGHO2_12_FULL_37_34]
MTTKRKILVTSALPYANGPLHLGHMVGYIQADIWVRLQKMLGHDCLYVGGSDSHGTPIMIQAEKMGITPEDLIRQIHSEQKQDFEDFMIEFDNYYTTHSEENREIVETIFKRHLAKGNISKRTIKQLFDPEKKIFLPDRYIKGECPHCAAKDQYGDNCEACGGTYTPTELKNYYSILSGSKPIEKESEHYFFKLQHYESFLKSWTHHGHLQAEVTNKLDEWFTIGLREWDISRDAPYFGFIIPGEKDKYFYVWLDAPIGYMASFKNLCNKKNINFDDYWNPNSSIELYHFIGKDIIYFHALFWPAILHGADFRTPTAIFANGFLTIDGQKMSKSRGTFIKARTYLHHLHPEYLRYY